MSSSPHLQTSNSIVFLDPACARELRRSPRLPRWRTRGSSSCGNDNDDDDDCGGDNNDSPGGVFVLRFPPSPSQECSGDDASEESDDASTAGPTVDRRRRRHRAMAALRLVEERIHVNSDISARAVKEHLHEQKQRLTRFKSKFLRKITPSTSPFPPVSTTVTITALSSETNCPLQGFVEPGRAQVNAAHVAAEKETSNSIRSRCLHKRSALDSVWVPVALLGLCFGFSSAVLLLLCWFYLHPIIMQVLALQDSKGGNDRTDAPSQAD